MSPSRSEDSLRSVTFTSRAASGFNLFGKPTDSDVPATAIGSTSAGSETPGAWAYPFLGGANELTATLTVTKPTATQSSSSTDQPPTGPPPTPVPHTAQSAKADGPPSNGGALHSPGGGDDGNSGDGNGNTHPNPGVNNGPQPPPGPPPPDDDPNNGPADGGPRRSNDDDDDDFARPRASRVKEADSIELMKFPQGTTWRTWRAHNIHAIVSAAGRQGDFWRRSGY